MGHRFLNALLMRVQLVKTAPSTDSSHCRNVTAFSLNFLCDPWMMIHPRKHHASRGGTSLGIP